MQIRQVKDEVRLLKEEKKMVESSRKAYGAMSSKTSFTGLSTN